MTGPAEEEMTSKSASRKTAGQLVCMLSHTKVNRDARVCRTAEALLQHGYRLELICLQNADEPEIPQGLENATIRQIKDLRAAYSRAVRQRELRHSGRRAMLGIAGTLLQIWRYLPARAPVRLPLFLLKCVWFGWRARPQIVHNHDLNVLPAGWLISFLTGATLYYDSHELFTEKAGLQFKSLWKLLEWVLVRRCQSVITTTEARASVLRELYPKIRHSIVIHNFPTIWSGGREDIRDVAHLPSNAFVALYQGGIQLYRGLEEMVQAATYIEGDRIYIVIQGDGPISRKIESLARKSPAADRIRVLPGGPNVYLRRFTASADVGLQLLQPISLNHTTTLSNKLFEYAQAGLPVIVADFPMIRSYVNKYDFGILVDPTVPREIADGIAQVYENGELRRRLVEGCRKAATVLNWGTEKETLLRLYEDLT